MKVYLEDDPYFRIIQLIDSISHNNRRHVERRLKPLNMTYSQMAVLMMLQHADGISQRELADMGDTDTTNMMVICDSLEKRGWVNRVTHESDRRIKRIYITEKGKKAFEDGQTILQDGIMFMRKKTPAAEILKVQPFLKELDMNTKAMYEGRIEEDTNGDEDNKE
ncbi:MAG: MarR family transcriptional regulator [Dehalococcoidales bacterium]|nr:MarR family transcriptional regulator [Dehalococcoidales bacterium]